MCTSSYDTMLTTVYKQYGNLRYAHRHLSKKEAILVPIFIRQAVGAYPEKSGREDNSRQHYHFQSCEIRCACLHGMVVFKTNVGTPPTCLSCVWMHRSCRRGRSAVDVSEPVVPASGISRDQVGRAF